MNKLLIFLASLPLISLCQVGSIEGTVKDATTGELLINAVVQLTPGQIGTVTDFDGNFQFSNIKIGEYQIKISYLAYQDTIIKKINVSNNITLQIPVWLSNNKISLNEISITATAKRDGLTALMQLQKNNQGIGEGISGDAIKKSTDKNISDALKRVSGVSIQDNKFAIIRGLGERYNMVMVNGIAMSSTEPDKRAFSFDIFPANLIDQIFIQKTATADLPAEFAGGAILLKTKNIPEENFNLFSFALGYLDGTTGRRFMKSETGRIDFIGMDDGRRNMPQNFPETELFQSMDREQQINNSKMMPNDWKIEHKKFALPSIQAQFTKGLLYKFYENKTWGNTISFYYNLQSKSNLQFRSDYASTERISEYTDNISKQNPVWSVLWNSALQFNDNNKLYILTNLNTNTENTIIKRSGSDFEQERYVRSSSIEYNENHLLTTKLGAENTFSRVSLDYGIGYNYNLKSTPSLRRMHYSKNFDELEGIPYRAYIPLGSADPYRSGRFYSSLNEHSYFVFGNVNIPLKQKSKNEKVKLGFNIQKRNREFDARVIGYIKANPTIFEQTLLTLEPYELFAEANIRESGFMLNEITNPTDRYVASALNTSLYAMYDQQFYSRIKLNLGFRLENYTQIFNGIDYTLRPVDLNEKYISVLPSTNISYDFTSNHKLRFSVYRTISRPEFRELAPFSFYDFSINGNVTGSPSLVPGYINNFDFRYEFYPGKNQIISVSLFEKKFYNPIEFTFINYGAGSKTFSYQNIPAAETRGIELEVRAKLNIIHKSLSNFTWYSNISVMQSSLDLKNVSSYDTKRSMQGQSPYLINCNLSYEPTNSKLFIGIAYNRFADRIVQVGTVGYADTYEKAKDQLDIILIHKFNNKASIKLAAGDIFGLPNKLYQDINSSHKYDPGNDLLLQKTDSQRSFSVGLQLKI
ncbi:MAG: TonB-dependent receptor [Saprospiraceae bacterium]|nr:TonB-dependent receptor [Saprospiraceae bacterium]